MVDVCPLCDQPATRFVLCVGVRLCDEHAMEVEQRFYSEQVREETGE